MVPLYWTNGSAQIRLYHASMPEAEVKAAIGILDDFRSQCQRLWFAFDGMINGRPLALQQLQQRGASRHNTLSAGTQFPDQEQSIGKSTIASINIGELTDAMADGGEFEQLNAKALLVFMADTWEESTRAKIADALRVAKDDIKCDLMGDLHRLRNLIVHQSEKARREYVEKATFLPQIWTIDPNNVTISGAMIHAMLEQLNAMHVLVDEGH